MDSDPAVSAAFDEIFGEALKPLGFVRPGIKLPYYIRLVNNEIIHIVGINDMKSHLFPFGSVATVYREDLCLNRSFRQNENWLKTAMDFYVRWHASDIEFDQRIFSGFHHQKSINPNYATETVQGALDASVAWILPVLDRVQTLKDVLDFYRNRGDVLSLPLQECHAAPFSDNAIYYLLDDPFADLDERRAATIKAVDIEDEKFHRPQEVIDSNRADYAKRIEESRRNLRLFQEDEEIHRQTMEELARRRELNLKLLRKYGVDCQAGRE